MLKKTFIWILMAFCVYTLSAQKSMDCMGMHKGQFYYGNKEVQVKVLMKKKKHWEYHENGKYFIKSKIKWINDCEYVATLIKSTIPNFPYKKGTKLHVRIVDVDGEKYSYTTEIEGETWEGVFIKVLE